MSSDQSEQISIDDFLKVDIRVGKIIDVEEFPEARKPAWKLKIDFGEKIGVKKTSAQIVANYNKEDLMGRLVMAVVNFPPRQIGPRVVPARARPVPFCFQGFLPPPLTSERDFCAFVPARALAWYETIT